VASVKAHDNKKIILLFSSARFFSDDTDNMNGPIQQKN
jgi:hypothetical protein